MAGFEVIVRPVVFPNIRPAPARSLAPEDNPEQGIAVLSGSSGKLLDLSRSESGSWSRSRKTETRRKVDQVRVYQKEDDGTINKDNFIDTERLKKMQFRDAHENSTEHYSRRKLADNEELLKEDVTHINDKAGEDAPSDDRLPPAAGEGGGGGGGEGGGG